MNESAKIERRKTKNDSVRNLVNESKSICSSFFKEKYTHSNTEAVEELGLDNELIDQLVEDYISQIIKSVILFEEYIDELKSNKKAKNELDYTKLRELAHKNLGVAKNLRIKDAEILLSDLMKKDDLEHLLKCVKVLRACAIKLKPEYAFNTIKLIEIKSSF